MSLERILISPYSRKIPGVESALRCRITPDGNVISITGKSQQSAQLTIHNATNYEPNQSFKLDGADMLVLSTNIVMANCNGQTKLFTLTPASNPTSLNNNINLHNAVIWNDILVCLDRSTGSKKLLFFSLNGASCKLLAMKSLPTPFGIGYLAAFTNTQLAAVDNNRIYIIEKNSTFEKMTELFTGYPIQLFAKKSKPLIGALPKERLISIENTENGFVRIWNAKRRCVAQSRGGMPLRAENKLLVMPDGQAAICLGAKNAEIIVWNLNSLQGKSIEFTDPDFKIEDFDIFPDGNLLLATSHGLIVHTLKYFLELKIKSSIRELTTPYVTRDPATIIADYTGDDIKVTPSKFDNYPLRLFSYISKSNGTLFNEDKKLWETLMDDRAHMAP